MSDLLKTTIDTGGSSSISIHFEVDDPLVKKSYMGAIHGMHICQSYVDFRPWATYVWGGFVWHHI